MQEAAEGGRPQPLEGGSEGPLGAEGSVSPAPWRERRGPASWMSLSRGAERAGPALLDPGYVSLTPHAAPEPRPQPRGRPGVLAQRRCTGDAMTSSSARRRGLCARVLTSAPSHRAQERGAMRAKAGRAQARGVKGKGHWWPQPGDCDVLPPSSLSTGGRSWASGQRSGALGPRASIQDAPSGLGPSRSIPQTLASRFFPGARGCGDRLARRLSDPGRAGSQRGVNLAAHPKNNRERSLTL